MHVMFIYMYFDVFGVNVLHSSTKLVFVQFVVAALRQCALTRCMEHARQSFYVISSCVALYTYLIRWTHFYLLTSNSYLLQSCGKYFVFWFFPILSDFTEKTAVYFGKTAFNLDVIPMLVGNIFKLFNFARFFEI